jgi:hypothetical protein
MFRLPAALAAALLAAAPPWMPASTAAADAGEEDEAPAGKTGGTDGAGEAAAETTPAEQARDDELAATNEHQRRRQLERSWDTAPFAPAGVDAPAIRNVEPTTRVYVDGSFARSTDLSALPYIGGAGANWRATAGGSLKLGRFQLEAEAPAAQATLLHLTKIPPPPGEMPIPEDARQTALSAGNVRLGAQWSGRFAAGPLAMAAGFGLRGRIPWPNSARFQFHLADGSLGVYSFPFYFHIEPTVLFGAATKGVSFTMNQGAVILHGPDGHFEEVTIVVPTIMFWDAHYAVAVRSDWVALSLELNTLIQFNRVGGDFVQLNDIRALSVVPGVQFLLGAWRVDLVGRLGVNRGAELFGVIGYGGTQSITLRLGRSFD